MLSGLREGSQRLKACNQRNLHGSEMQSGTKVIELTVSFSDRAVALQLRICQEETSNDHSVTGLNVTNH